VCFFLCSGVVTPRWYIYVSQLWSGYTCVQCLFVESRRRFEICVHMHARRDLCIQLAAVTSSLLRVCGLIYACVQPWGIERREAIGVVNAWFTPEGMK